VLGVTFFCVLDENFPSERRGYKGVIIEIINSNEESPETYSKNSRTFIKNCRKQLPNKDSQPKTLILWLFQN
jgi:hypothetical protein